ncbi:hnRNP-L/PTB/hephaestus splicing factor family protein [Cooperia oncophora]
MLELTIGEAARAHRYYTAMTSQANAEKEGVPPAKRFRHNEHVDPLHPDPSPVVHVRNLGAQVTEADLIESLGSFGTIAYVTMLQAQRMALVEFEEQKAATACINFAASNLIYVGGGTPMFNYSTSKKVQRTGFESDTPSKVLVITVYNVRIPIDVHVFHRVCCPHAHVVRAAIVRKSVMQALVEFENVESARKVKHATNGADIYPGSCTLKVEFAKLEFVKVTRQDAEQWDYTCAQGELPGGPQPRKQRKTLLPAPEPYGYVQAGYPGSNIEENSGKEGGSHASSGLLGSSPYDSQDSLGRGILRPLPAYQSGDHGDCQSSLDLPGRVVMIYGVDREKLNCEKLFSLLCQYGNVLRIRFMGKKRDTAMAELGTPTAVGQCYKISARSYTIWIEDVRLKTSISKCRADDVYRFSTPEVAARNRLTVPTKVLHWYNAPADMTEEKIRQASLPDDHNSFRNILVFSSRNAPELKSVTVFLGKTGKSSAGIVELETIEQANEALVLVNHTRVHTPLSKVRRIVDE